MQPGQADNEVAQTPPIDDQLAGLLDLWRARAGSASAADCVYATLREGIVTGRLKAGTALVEESVGKTFGVTRTPVREAILRLESAQLATRIPRRGLVVSTISLADVLEVYTVRTALDSLAARLAAENALPAERAQLRWLNQCLRTALDANDALRAQETSAQFHDALALASHNRVLCQFAQQVNERVRRFGASTFFYRGRYEESVVEHERIVDAIDAGDPATAERIARDHTMNAHQARVGLLTARDED